MKKILAIAFLLFVTLQGLNAQGCDEPSGDEGVRIIGYVQSEYQYTFSDEPTNSFGFRRARLGVTGNIPYDFQYYALVETSPFLSDETGNAYLLDAFVTYSRLSWLKVSMGAFKNPFGLELSTACHSLNTIYRSTPVTELVGPLRDMGLMVLGGSNDSFLQYRVALLNASGIKTIDNDKFKDVVGRVVLTPTRYVSGSMLNYVRLGFSGRYGKRAAPIEGAAIGIHERLGSDLDVSFLNFQLQAEYIYAHNEGSYTVGGGCSGGEEIMTGSVNRQGYMVMGMYKWREMIQPVVKYEYYNADLDAIIDEYIKHTTFGVNIFFNEWTRMQINYIYAAEFPREKTGVSNVPPYSDQLIVQVQFKL